MIAPADSSPSRRWTLAALALTALAAIYYEALVLHQYAAFHTSNEVPAFEDLLWQALRGHGLRTAPGEPSFLGHHFSPILYLLVPIYALWQSTQMMVTIHALVTASAVYPLWKLAETKLGNGGWALMVAACYPLSRTINYGVLTGFHMEAFYPAAALWAFLFAERRQWKRFAAAILLFLSVKEDAAIPIAGLGLYLWLAGSRRAGALTTGGALAWFFLSLWVLIPAFRAGEPDREWEFAHYWSAYGSNAGELLRNMLDPRMHARVLFTPEKLSKTFNAFSVFLFLPFVSWRALLFLVFPSWFILFSSDRPLLYGMLGYYGFMITPFLFYATLDGLDRLRSRFDRAARWAPVVIAVMLGINLANARLWKQMRPSSLEVPARVASGRAILEQIPPGAVVAAQFELLAQLPPDRRRLLLPTPEFMARAEYLIFDLEGNTYPVSAAENREVFERFQNSGEFELLEHHDGYALLRRH